MCGLAGWLCVPQMAPEPELLDRMLAAIQHRGPDDRGDYRDAWFVGYTPELVIGVWVGFDDERAIRLTGSQAALPAHKRSAAC